MIAVNVSDNRHRPPVGVLIGTLRVAALYATRRVRPVQGLVDRQEMWQEVALPVDEAVDPLDPNRP
jgi:hypothetical protein